MDNVRVNLTNNEKLSNLVTSFNGTSINMNSENDIRNLIEKEKAYKFNEELDKIAEKFEDVNKKLEENAEAFGDSIANIEIKPMGYRLLIKPFRQNPFQRVKVENGIIVDAGGFDPHKQFNPKTGREEEQEEIIVTGAVQEVGPDVRYIKPGDVIFYRKDCCMPVPFFKQGFVSVAESNVIAIVNEGLETRFNEINNGR